MSDQCTTSENVVWHGGFVPRSTRESQLGQRGCVLWFTGLSGSGKSTIARHVEQQLTAAGKTVYVLDGDNVRHGLNGDLGFGAEDRTENIRRISEVAALFSDSGLITLTAFISPYRADRAQARKVVEAIDEREQSLPPPTPRFIEVFIDVPIEVCESRDPKQLYKKARAGEISDFTGISSPYEAPDSPEITINTPELPPAENAAKVVTALRLLGVIS